MPRITKGLSLSTSSSKSRNQQAPQSHRVAIIGGGIAGLSCAQRLSAPSTETTTKPKLDATVFDTGRLRPGGRFSSRFPNDRPKEGNSEAPNSGVKYEYLSQCVVDHAAQMIALPQNGNGMDQFINQVLEWEKQGTLLRYPTGSLFDIVSDKGTADTSFQLQPFPSDSPMYHGNGGNGVIPLTMANNENFEMVQDVWVSPSSGVRYLTKSKEWKVQAAGQVLGYFDTLIIAHNGKCADRLMSKTPAKRVHELLKVNFASNAPRDGGKRMTLNSLYSLTFALDKKDQGLSHSLPAPFIAGNIRNEPSLRFLSCQSRKYPSTSLEKDGIEVWTLLSSAALAKKHKAPQEFLPTETVEEVTALMLQGLERSLGMEPSSLRPVESRLQLWGAAVPLNTWQSAATESPTEDSSTVGFIYDPEFSVGVCGDWLLQPSAAGAWTSGQRLADHLLSLSLKGGDGPSSSSSLSSSPIGLDGQFVRNEEAHQAGIAAFGKSQSTKSNMVETTV